MKTRILIVGVFFLGATALGVLVWSQSRAGTSAKQLAAAVEPSMTTAPAAAAERTPGWQGTLRQMPASLPGKYDASLPQWQEWQRRKQEDPRWEWKVEISFYGRVLDQDNEPVAGARVVVSCTDLSREGTSVRELVTDDRGDFRLSGIRGKHLLVRSIEKRGYEPAATNRDGFEYAAFFDESYHIPDAKNPVVFRMHRRGATEPLIVVSDKFRIPESGTLAVDLKSGRVGGEDVQIEMVDNSDPTGRKWVAKVRAPSGGVQMASDEFSVLAPASGYVPELTIDQDTPQPAGFQSGSLYKGGRFFVKTAAGYAVVEFRMVPGNKSLHLTSHLNPDTSSRNLEYDPTESGGQETAIKR